MELVVLVSGLVALSSAKVIQLIMRDTMDDGKVGVLRSVTALTNHLILNANNNSEPRRRHDPQGGG